MPKLHQNTFGGRPGSTLTRWGSFSAPPDPLAAIKGLILLRGGRRGEEREERGEENGGKGTGRTPH